MPSIARLLVTLAVAAALFAILLVPVPAQQRGLVAHGAGFVVLPYLALALASRSVSARVWAIALLAFLVGTTLGVLAMLAGTSGGVALEWIVPAQAVAATVLAAVGIASHRRAQHSLRAARSGETQVQ